MADIFISYARGDRDSAERLARALQACGWSVWWDQTIPPGMSFPAVIEKELTAAGCVIVLWSRVSVASKWVKREARFADNRDKLIPALIAEIKPPFEFSEIHAASLIDWRANPSHPGFRQLVAAVADMVGTAAPRARLQRKGREGTWPKRIAVALVAVLVIFGIGIAVYELIQPRIRQKPTPLAMNGNSIPSLPASGPGGSTRKTVAACPPTCRPHDVFKDCDVCPEMVVVPAGWFSMGSPPSEPDRERDEGPVSYPVKIATPFAVGKYEITRGEYARFAERSGRSGEGGCWVWTGSKWNYDPAKSWQNPGFVQRDDHPAVCVSWHDAQAYVEWLRSETGQDYRLLTEAEWEYVARADTSTLYWWGDEIGYKNANCAGCGSIWDNEQTAPVNSFAANAFGVHDIHGNVWEWVADCYREDAYETHNDYPSMVADRQNSCETHVIRGGSWSDTPRLLRAANRAKYAPGARLDTIGFRVARTLPSADP
jgi:formylglycine-generating enzyme required for sulfatase activity